MAENHEDNHDEGVTENTRSMRHILEGAGGVMLAAAIVYLVASAMDARVFHAAVEERLEVIETGLQERPPPWLLDDLREIRLELQRQQRLIDRLEGAIPGVTNKPLPPYTLWWWSDDLG